MTLPSADWLDEEPKKIAAPRKRTRKSKKARAAKKPVEVVSVVKIAGEAARRFGEGRVWGCDGTLVFYRPRRMIDGVMTQVANPTMVERHERYLRSGHYKYLATYDDVQVYEVTDLSPFKRKFGSIEGIDFNRLLRCLVMSAVKREWPMYVDCLEEAAHRFQRMGRTLDGRVANDGKGFGSLHQTQWQEMLSYIEIQIRTRGGPTPEECAMQMQRVMLARNGGEEKRILVI